MEFEKKLIYIVPHTHWDREWYEPFQVFRAKLVKLIDLLCSTIEKKPYKFLLDGQTVVLEDYFEIRPDNKEKLLKLIRKGNVIVGPWYVLPDEWLVGAESLIRNLELSLEIARKFEIPLMQVGYLPDQFGHTSFIPQLLADLTTYPVAVIWRGVGEEINTTYFSWKRHENATKAIDCIYLAQSYSNAASLPAEPKELKEMIDTLVQDLEPYSPVPVYLLMNGTDHQFPNPQLYDQLEQIKDPNMEIELSTLGEFYKKLKEDAKKKGYHAPIYSGEFRSPARAPLLQDTYSARIWIKQWNQKNEDLLVHYAEPLALYLWLKYNVSYPTNYLTLAWKWLLKNQPHDSICGCSIDRVHNEMISRFSWSETIADSIIKEFKEKVYSETANKNNEYQVLVWNPTNSSEPQYFEFNLPLKIQAGSLEIDGKLYPIQAVESKEEVFFEQIMSPFKLKAGIKLLPGRKIADLYINELIIHEYPENKTAEVLIVCDKQPEGDFDVNNLKNKALEMLNSKKYNTFHVKILKGAEQRYGCVAPLKPWSINVFNVSPKKAEPLEIICSNNLLENQFYKITIHSDASFTLEDKQTGVIYPRMHFFEDLGDRGDEYTFSKVTPNKNKIVHLKKKVIANGSVFSALELTYELVTFKELDESRNKRVGKAKIPIKTIIKLYSHSIPRVDIRTELLNTAKDHRLRVCFKMPFLTDYTLTSTHLGVIKRQAEPETKEHYEEQASSIQPQKRFIRVENPQKDEAFTLINKGLPEVALENKDTIALTLLRSVGFLSRSDFPERPVHAGPFIETPGAQELYKHYIYEYSIVAHRKAAPIHISNDLAESFCLEPLTLALKTSSLSEFSFINVNNEWIKVSSMRLRNNKIVTTLYNLDSHPQSVQIYFPLNVSKCARVKIDGTIVTEYTADQGNITLEFQPFEIIMLELTK